MMKILKKIHGNHILHIENFKMKLIFTNKKRKLINKKQHK